MSGIGEILWEVREERAKYHDHIPEEGSESFDFFLNFCKTKLPSEDLVKSYHSYTDEKNRLNKEVEKSIEIISQLPFLTAFLVWIKEIAIYPPERLAAKALLEKGFIGISDKNGQIWTLAKARSFDHRHIVEAIRCHRDWPFLVRENFVKTYLHFMQWLSKTSYGYIFKLEDPDLERSRSRSLAYSNFIHFLSKLKEEDQLIAKLLYFGGSRTLEEILTLNIGSVDFDKRLVYFGLQPISYPLHIFADIKDLSQERKKGKIFIGRRGVGTALNPATIFRNFKEAAVEIGLDHNFTPKILTTNV